MSTIRMCDRDGGQFSTNQEGWGSAKLEIHRKYADGSTYVETRVMDFCAPCVQDMAGNTKVPMAVLEGMPLPVQTDRP